MYISPNQPEREPNTSHLVRLKEADTLGSGQRLLEPRGDKEVHVALSNPPTLSFGFLAFLICLSLIAASLANSMLRRNVNFSGFFAIFAVAGCVRKGILVE